MIHGFFWRFLFNAHLQKQTYDQIFKTELNALGQSRQIPNIVGPSIIHGFNKFNYGSSTDGLRFLFGLFVMVGISTYFTHLSYCT